MIIFAAGQILKMDVASRSHVSQPYYVEVLEYNPYAKDGEVKMVTNIPGKHSCKMIVGSNWEYHLPRMTVVGMKEKYGHLLNNQKFL